RYDLKGPNPAVDMSIRLTDEQQTAVGHVRGGLLVDAPAGTGKTTVLAHRVLRAVEEGVRPDRILCVSFSNRACREMRERLTSLSPVTGRILARTFHGLCTTILRWEARRLGMSPDFVIFDETERDDAIRRSAGSLHPDRQIENDLFAFTIKLISGLKSEFIPPYDKGLIAERFEEFRVREANAARQDRKSVV